MDAKILADAVTIILAPALPFLVSGGGELVKEAGKALGENAPEILKSLWAKLRPKVEEKPAAAEAVEEVAKAPEDADAQGALRIQLRKILESDPALAAEIAGLVKEAQAAASYHVEVHGSGAASVGQGNVAAGQGGIAAGGDVRVTESLWEIAGIAEDPGSAIESVPVSERPEHYLTRPPLPPGKPRR